MYSRLQDLGHENDQISLGAGNCQLPLIVCKIHSQCPAVNPHVGTRMGTSLGSDVCSHIVTHKGIYLTAYGNLRYEFVYDIKHESIPRLLPGVLVEVCRFFQ